MLMSMSGGPGVRPDDIAGLAAAAVTMAAGIGAVAVSERAAEKMQAERLANLARMGALTASLGLGTEELQKLQFREMATRFREARLYSRIFLLMISLFAVVFLWGGVSLILGITAAHVVTVLASAIPGVGSALFKHASNVAVRRSDEAFKTLSRRVEDADAMNRRRAALAKAQELKFGETLNVLETIKSIVPNATPEQLASIMKDLPAITSRTAEEEDLS